MLSLGKKSITSTTIKLKSYVKSILKFNQFYLTEVISFDITLP